MTHDPVRTIACGAGFAGDRIDPAVALARSGRVDSVVLECLAERTLLPGLRARQSDPEAGADPRLRRRLSPLLPPAKANRCRIISNLGAANPAAAVRQIAHLATSLGCAGIKVAGVIGDDVLSLKEHIAWDDPVQGELLGAHAYLGTSGIVEAVDNGADVIVTGRVADSALFAGDLLPYISDTPEAFAGAVAVGHLLECSGQITGGNFEAPGGVGLEPADYADLGFPIAAVMADGSAEIHMLDGAPGRVDRLTCTVQLLYEVHDPAHYITPDLTVDFTGIRLDEIGRNRVRVSGTRAVGRPTHLKVSGFIERKGMIADVEIAFAGTYAERRAQQAAETLRLRLQDWPPDSCAIDLVGVNSVLGGAAKPASGTPSEVRVHISARCEDAAAAQTIEDEVYALTLSGPAGGCSVRSERRPRIEVLDGLIDRNLVKTTLEWATAS